MIDWNRFKMASRRGKRKYTSREVAEMIANDSEIERSKGQLFYSPFAALTWPGNSLFLFSYVSIETYTNKGLGKHLLKVDCWQFTILI